MIAQLAVCYSSLFFCFCFLVKRFFLNLVLCCIRQVRRALKTYTHLYYIILFVPWRLVRGTFRRRSVFEVLCLF